MAVSTALRQRYRLGEVPQLAVGNFRVVSDAVDVVDNAVDTWVRIVSGDRIETLSDSFQELDDEFIRILSESFATADSIAIEKSISPKLVDSITVSDSFVRNNIAFRQLSDTLDLNENFVKAIERGDTFTIYSKILIEPIEFSDNIAVFVVPPKIITEESIVIKDAVIVNAIQTSNVVLADVFDVTDAFQKSITRTFISTIYSKTLKDIIDVIDSVDATFLGINQRTLTDAVSLSDFDALIEMRISPDTLDTADSATILRWINRILTKYVPITDDVIVGRTSINNEQADLSTIAVSDFAFATFESGQPVSSPIEHGIEVF